jgi:hypothetical protein
MADGFENAALALFAIAAIFGRVYPETSPRRR